MALALLCLCLLPTPARAQLRGTFADTAAEDANDDNVSPEFAVDPPPFKKRAPIGENDFVRRIGTRFVVGVEDDDNACAPFYFSGTNTYYLMVSS